MNLMLKAEGLLKSFGGLTAVANVDLAVAEGEIRSVIGTNGAGKTTLFNLLTGYWKCDAGKVFLDGRDITSISAPERVCLGVARTFQRTNIFANLSVEENVLIPLLRKHGRSRNVVTPSNRLYKKEIEDLLESVALSEQRGRIAGTLSHGHQRCLELAIALANSPRLLLLDEPAAGMSVSECAQMMDLVKNINQQRNLTILLTEHDMNVVFSLSERITVMHLGRVIAEGTPDEIKNNSQVQQIYLGEVR
jgi:branched-chain amino acid transport system ATP-binding protein